MIALLELPASAADEFEQFWQAYPKKRAKPAARKALLHARRDTAFATIMAGLAAYRFDTRLQYVPYPATWINQRRWEDPVEPDPRLDPWGLRAWFAAQPEPAAMFSVRGYEIAALEEVLLAAGFEHEWRGDLDTLGRWLLAGFRPDSVAEVVAELAATSVSKPGRLIFFERAVQRRALRWNAIRMEWQRG